MFGHNEFVWTPLSASQILGADTFSAEQVSNPCSADYLIESASGGRFKGYGRSSPNDDGSHPGYYFMGWFGSAQKIHTYAQTSGKGIKWANKSDWDATDAANCPTTTSGRASVTWPYDENAVIVVKYLNGTRWGFFRPKSATSRGLAGGWFTGSEAGALAKSYVTSNYVILDAGICGSGSFAVNLTPEEILAEAQACATPSNCQVGAWSAWSSCSNGTRTRTRTVTNPSTNGGTTCPALTESQTCSNCETSAWSSWTACGCNGQKSRSRTITQQPTNGGSACPSLAETSSCTPPASCNTTTGGGSVTPCADANRNTVTDGSCDADCKTGYEFDSNNDCVAVSANDPNDCATNNQEKNDDDTCGDCLSGFTADATGVCVADEDDEETETNWLLYGGIGVAAIAVFMMG